MARKLNRGHRRDIELTADDGAIEYCRHPVGEREFRPAGEFQVVVERVHVQRGNPTHPQHRGRAGLGHRATAWRPTAWASPSTSVGSLAGTCQSSAPNATAI